LCLLCRSLRLDDCLYFSSFSFLVFLLSYMFFSIRSLWFFSFRFVSLLSVSFFSVLCAFLFSSLIYVSLSFLLASRLWFVRVVSSCRFLYVFRFLSFPLSGRIFFLRLFWFIFFSCFLFYVSRFGLFLDWW
jgi:hypothetical protein